MSEVNGKIFTRIRKSVKNLDVDYKKFSEEFFNEYRIYNDAYDFIPDFLGASDSIYNDALNVETKIDEFFKIVKLDMPVKVKDYKEMLKQVKGIKADIIMDFKDVYDMFRRNGFSDLEQNTLSQSLIYNYIKNQ